MDPNQMRKLMQQAAQMQSKMEEAQRELMEATFEGTSGGGVVTAAVKGNGEVVRVDIDPSVLDPDDPEMVGDLVVAAINQAVAASQEAMAGQMGEVTGGLDLGDLGKMLGG